MLRAAPLDVARADGDLAIANSMRMGEVVAEAVAQAAARPALERRRARVTSRAVPA
jgi:hypothetical protein